MECAWPGGRRCCRHEAVPRSRRRASGRRGSRSRARRGMGARRRVARDEGEARRTRRRSAGCAGHCPSIGGAWRQCPHRTRRRPPRSRARLGGCRPRGPCPRLVPRLRRPRHRGRSPFFGDARRPLGWRCARGGPGPHRCWGGGPSGSRSWRGSHGRGGGCCDPRRPAWCGLRRDSGEANAELRSLFVRHLPTRPVVYHNDAFLLIDVDRRAFMSWGGLEGTPQTSSMAGVYDQRCPSVIVCSSPIGDGTSRAHHNARYCPARTAGDGASACRPWRCPIATGGALWTDGMVGAAGRGELARRSLSHQFMHDGTLRSLKVGRA